MTTSYERNKEKRLAYQRAYAAEHKEATAIYRAAYFQRVTKLKRQKEASQALTPSTPTPLVQLEEPRTVEWD
jgi:hypothetical protein